MDDGTVAAERDDDLERFAAAGTPSLPETGERGVVETDGARIWYAAFGSGPPVVLLHGGLGSADNWSYQVPALLAAGYRVIAIDSRGHGRSTRDERPFHYAVMARDVGAVLDALGVAKAALVGWSDGATIALIVALNEPARVAGVFFFAGNMNVDGVHPMSVPNVRLQRMFGRHAQDYARLSPTPREFKAFAAAVGLMMSTEPDYSADQLGANVVPVAIVQSQHDEFIKREHADYLARTVARAHLVELAGVSHFAPLQRPADFNGALLAFLEHLPFGAPGPAT